MKPKISDIILISVLLIGVIISAIFIYMPKNPSVNPNTPPITNSNNDNLYCIIEIDNEIVDEIDFPKLTSETTFIYDGVYTKIEIKADSKGVWVAKSGCRTQQCVKHKKITGVNEIIICAYNSVEVKILER